MLGFVISVIKIIFLLGFLITIHECGHFMVAKFCKVKVNEFAIGFGPTIWRKQGRETKYAIRLIPLGGFVSMEGEEERSENSGSFSKASIPKRIAICLAGATVNIVFGLAVYFILMVTSGVYTSNEVETTLEGYAASTMGIQKDDKIVAIDGKKINSKYDIDSMMEKATGKEMEVTLLRNEETIQYHIIPTKVNHKSTGMYLDNQCKVITVQKGSSSEKQGVKPNDVILKINGEEMNQQVEKVAQIMNEEALETMVLTLKRGTKEIQIEITPDTIHSYYLGITLKKAPDTFANRCIYGGVETKQFVISMVDNLKQLFTGKVSVDQMMGPVGISEAVAKTEGWYEFIYMLALISFSLGVTNLLPIPALDGGKILILLIEAIRRKPLKEKTEINIQLLGFSLLIALSLYITYNDILRIF